MVNGKRVKDSCGRCLFKSDKEFDSCPDIIDCDVGVVPGHESTPLVLTVAGMKERLTCLLEGDNGRYAI